MKNLFLLMTTLLVITSPSFAQGSANSKIAFTSSIGSNVDIFIMNADGSAQTRLTDDPGIDIDPALSPDGDRIAFSSDRTGNFEIYVMNADGSGLTQLTNIQRAGEPAWSPDGSRIAFGCGVICVMNADGSSLIRLTDGGGLSDFSPTWSPDGQEIAFASNRDDPLFLVNIDLFVVNADGSGLRHLAGGGNNPSWSPDGSKILYEGFEGIWVVNADGSDPRRFIETAPNPQPTWSPDGQQIAFMDDLDEPQGPFNFEIFKINADGTGKTRLTNNPGYDTSPSWSR